MSIHTPLGIEGLPNVYQQLQALMFTLIFVASASLVVRLLHAREVERQQIKWVAFAGALAASASLPTFTVFEAMDLRWLKWLEHIAALVTSQASRRLWIAILRHHLYDIDRIITAPSSMEHSPRY